MILRVDKLAIELPMPANPSPNSASAVQELLGGKFGEFDSMGNPWNGTDVFSSGNLKLDLLHNFFLHAVRGPTRSVCTRWWTTRSRARWWATCSCAAAPSGVRESARGADGSGGRQALPMPDISNKRFPEAKKHEAKGLHQLMYRMSPDDFRDISMIWNGPHPEDGSELRVVDGLPEGDRSRCIRWSRS